MANQPQSTFSLLQNRRDRLVARRVRALAKGDQLALDKEIEAVDKLMSVAKGRGEPALSVDLNESGMKVNIKPTTITSRNKSKIIDDGRYADVTGPARNDLGQTASTSAQVSTPSPIQPVSPSGKIPQPQGISKEAELANAYAANVAAPAPSIPSPEDLDFPTRVSLAVAGALNPQFFESTVAPQIGARMPTPADKLKLQGMAEGIKSERLQQMRGEGELQRNVLQREEFEYEKARTQQELHAGFGHLAQEIMGSDGKGEGTDSLIQTLKAGAQQAAAAGLQVEANNLIRYAATLKGIREHDADYRKSIGMEPIPSGPGDLQWFAGQAKEAKAALDDVIGRVQSQRVQQRLIDATNARNIKMPAARQKEQGDWDAILQTAQAVLGRRQMLGDIGGPLAGHFSFMNQPQADEDADLSVIKGAIGRILGGGAALTTFERNELRGLYTQLTDTATTKTANMQALIRYATKKLNGLAVQYGLSDQLGDGAGNELDVERVRQDGGVLVGHSKSSGLPVYQMPDGEIREVSP